MEKVDEDYDIVEEAMEIERKFENKFTKVVKDMSKNIAAVVAISLVAVISPVTGMSADIEVDKEVVVDEDSKIPAWAQKVVHGAGTVTTSAVSKSKNFFKSLTDEDYKVEQMKAELEELKISNALLQAMVVKTRVEQGTGHITQMNCAKGLVDYLGSLKLPSVEDTNHDK